MENKSGNIDNSQPKGSDYSSMMLQTVYGAIKRERPWDIRPVYKMYTTAKEKYMIELIKDGHEFSDETIKHVVGRCYTFHDFDDGKYVCWFGFILTKKDYPLGHFNCKSFHRLNQRLVCHNRCIYYPVDILSNPFGEWQPEELKVKPEIQNVYTMIAEKWPDHWYGNELHKYTLKHLIKMIEIEEPLTEDVKRHVVDGCDIDHHELDGNYNCYSGFLLRQNRNADTICLRFHDGMLEYVMNPKFQQHTGIVSIPVSQLKFRNHQTAQQAKNENIRLWSPCVNRIIDRIIQRDLTCKESANIVRLSWQEHYLTDLLILGEDIPNEVISHVLDGCYTYAHRLTEKYTCCRGYILHRDLYFHHDVRKCMSNHTINHDLKCYEGRIYHRCAEIPKGSFKLMSRMTRDMPSPYDSCEGHYENLNEVINLRDRAQVVPPALPPRDHLDQPPDANVEQLNRAAERQNVDGIDDRAEVMAVVPNLNRHPNPAQPPPEVDI